MTSLITKLAVLIFISIPLFSQMPGWRFFKDRDGNKYFVDRNGKLWITGKPRYKYKPVSPLGIDYYVNQGRELIKQHHPVEGMIILKSILALPVNNNRIYKAKIKAARTLNGLKKREGDRFHGLNELASIQLFRKDKSIHVINDLMYYSLRLPPQVSVLRKRMKKRLRYQYYGLSLGVCISGKSVKCRGGKYDFLLALDSERFPEKIKSIEVVRNNWKMILGSDTLVRKKVLRKKNKIIYRFENAANGGYSGYEGIYLNGKYSHILRIISSKIKFSDHKKVMRAVAEGFEVVGLR